MMGKAIDVACSHIPFTFSSLPLSYVYRDPGAVLRALASTVDDVRPSLSLQAVRSTAWSLLVLPLPPPAATPSDLGAESF